MTVTYLDGCDAGVTADREEKILYLTLQAPEPNSHTEFVNIDYKLPYAAAMDLISLMLRVMHGDYVQSDGGDCGAYLSDNLSDEATDAIFDMIEADE